MRWRVYLRGVRQGEGEDDGDLHDDDVNFDVVWWEAGCVNSIV